MFGLCFRIQVRVLMHQIPHAHVLLAEGVILIKRLVAAMLTGHIGAHVGTARRHADAAVELHALFHAAVQHTGPVNAPQAGTSGACGAAFCIYETEENAQRSAPLERMTF